MNATILQAGAAESRIPAQPKLDLSGYVARDNPSRGKHDDIMVRALALRCGNCLLLLLSVDVLGFTVETAATIRAEIAQQVRTMPLVLPVGEIAVTLAATHTHSAPASQPLSGCGEVNGAWLRSLTGVLVSTAQQAIANLQPARLRYGKGEVQGVTRNRRGIVPVVDNTLLHDSASDGPCDRDIAILRIETLQSTLLAHVVNFACHPVVLGAENLDISADYPGLVVKNLSQQSGTIGLFLNGACGDINPIQRDSWGDVGRIATAITDEVERIEWDVATRDKVLLTARSRRLALPFLPLPPRAELETLAQQFLQEAKAATNTTQQRIALAFHLWAEKALRLGAPSTAVEIQVLRVGHAVIVSVPGELFTELGLQIKVRLREQLAAAGLRAVLISTYTNGNIGYIPTRSAYPLGGYEVETAHRFYQQPACLAPEAGEMIVDTAVTLAREIFSEEGMTR